MPTVSLLGHNGYNSFSLSLFTFSSTCLAGRGSAYTCRDVVMLTFLTAANRTWSSLGFCSMHLYQVRILRDCFFGGEGSAPLLNCHVPLVRNFICLNKQRRQQERASRYFIFVERRCRLVSVSYRSGKRVINALLTNH